MVVTCLVAQGIYFVHLHKLDITHSNTKVTGKNNFYFINFMYYIIIIIKNVCEFLIIKFIS